MFHISHPTRNSQPRKGHDICSISTQRTKVNEKVNELSSQSVVLVFKFNKFIEGKPHLSGFVLLIFNLYKLPNKIDVAWCKLLVRQYVPSPMRCKNANFLVTRQSVVIVPSLCKLFPSSSYPSRLRTHFLHQLLPTTCIII